MLWIRGFKFVVLSGFMLRAKSLCDQWRGLIKQCCSSINHYMFPSCAASHTRVLESNVSSPQQFHKKVDQGVADGPRVHQKSFSKFWVGTAALRNVFKN
eukprot:6047854-Amphidinium_carterae.1